MDIVSCTDNNYIIPLGVTMVSVFTHTKEDINYHIITTNQISNENKKKLQACAEKYNKKVYFYEIPQSLIDKFPLRQSGYITTASYIRLFIQEILPTFIKKVIYLDCDIIINQSLQEFWKTDLNNYSTGVILDSIYSDLSIYKRLDYDKKYKYFNAGVLLINLDYWRKNNIMNQCLLFITNHPERIQNEDQDVLNAILYNSTYYLPLKYNAVCAVFYKECPYGEDLKTQIDEARNYPVIIHYTYIKPWHIEDRHPLGYLFFKYLKLTPWHKFPLTLFYKNKNKYKAYIKRLIDLYLLNNNDPYIQL